MTEFHRHEICVKYTQHGARYIEAWEQVNLTGGKAAGISLYRTSTTFSDIQLPHLAIIRGNKLAERYEVTRNLNVLIGKLFSQH